MLCNEICQVSLKLFCSDQLFNYVHFHSCKWQTNVYKIEFIIQRKVCRTLEFEHVTTWYRILLFNPNQLFLTQIRNYQTGGITPQSRMFMFFAIVTNGELFDKYLYIQIQSDYTLLSFVWWFYSKSTAVLLIKLRIT